MAETLGPLFVELDRALAADSNDRALAFAEQILAVQPEDQDALECKLVLLIHAGRFADALALCPRFPKRVLEHAYCLFRTQEPQRALDLLRAGVGPTMATRELEAQLLYRTETYDDAVGLYREMLTANHEDDYEEERRANLLAAMAALATETPSRINESFETLPRSTYEQCYNTATLALALGRIPEAMALLAQAEDLCRGILHEETPNMSPEDMEEELGLLRVQTAVAHLVDGSERKAGALLNAVLRSHPDDPGLVTVAATNAAALNKDKDMFDSRKKMKLALSDAGLSKLTRHQRRILDRNECLVLLYTNQNEACRAKTLALEQADPSSDAPALIRAASLQREKKHGEALACLQQYAQRHPEHAVHVQLALAQLALGQGERQQACDVLALIASLQHSAGVVGAAVTLKAELGDIDGACQLLQIAVQYHKSTESLALAELLRGAADFCFNQQRFEASAGYYESLVALEPGDSWALAQLVISLSHYDAIEAEKYAQRLPQLPADVEQGPLDIDALEAAPRHIRTSNQRQLAVAVDATNTAVVMASKPKCKKKKRPGKLPKNYNPDIPPDPERWLPKRERSTFRGRRKKEKQNVGKGTQGAVGGPLPPGSTASTKVPAAEAAKPVSAPAVAKPAAKKKGKKKK